MNGHDSISKTLPIGLTGVEDIALAWIEVERLRHHGRRAHTHSRKQIGQIAEAATMLIEGGGIGRSLVQHFRRMKRETLFNARALLVPPKESKEARLMTAMEPLYSGKAMLPRVEPFMNALRHEMVLFPNAKHDDRCDRLSQALNYIVRHQKHLERTPGVRPFGRARKRPQTMSSNAFDDDFLV